MRQALMEILAHALMITGFVFVMMLVIEYLNVLTRGVWQQGLRGSRWRQYLLASLLGATRAAWGLLQAASSTTRVFSRTLSF